MNLEKYKQKIKTILNDVGLDELVFDYDCYIAGGFIRRIFCDDLNDSYDIDLYFSNQKDAINFCFEFSKISTIVSFTNKSISFLRADGLNKYIIQVIFFDFFKTPNDIFEKFDLRCCMGSYYPKEETFCFTDGFIEDNLEKKAIVNTKTSYPIVSLIRLEKYKKLGYKVGERELLKLALKISELKIETWDDFCDHLSGMYGSQDVLKAVKSEGKPFSVEEGVSIIEKYLPNSTQKGGSICPSEWEIFIKINKNPIYCYKTENKFIVGNPEKYSVCEQLPKDIKTIATDNIKEVVGNNNIFYKSLKPSSDPSTFKAWYRDFDYKLGEWVSDPTGNGFYFEKYPWKCPSPSGVFKFEVDFDSLKSIRDGDIRFSRCKLLGKHERLIQLRKQL